MILNLIFHYVIVVIVIVAVETNNNLRKNEDDDNNKDDDIDIYEKILNIVENNNLQYNKFYKKNVENYSTLISISKPIPIPKNK